MKSKLMIVNERVIAEVQSITKELNFIFILLKVLFDLYI